MNRPIIFRAVSYDSPNKFVFGYVFKNGYYPCIITNDWKEVRVRESTICEFTGIYDNTEFDKASIEQRQYAFDRAKIRGVLASDEWKGVMIFEDDIVKCTEYENIGMKEFRGEDLKLFSLKDFTGKVVSEYQSTVKFQDAGFCVQSNMCHCYFDTGLGCFSGDMRLSQPIFDIKVIGTIYDKIIK